VWVEWHLSGSGDWCVNASVDSTILESTCADLTTGFAALADPIRIRVVQRLARGEQCVCDLLTELDIAPNLLSYHLRVLRDAGLVEGTRRGRWIDYRLSRASFEPLQRALDVGEEGE
jgi:ArsR family transcriptional regulator